MKKILIIVVLICIVFFMPQSSRGENQTSVEINELSSIGMSLLQQGKFNDALEYFDKILVIDPNDVITLGNKGAALTQLNRHEEAIVLYNKALEIESTNIAILNNMAASLFELGKIDELLQTLDKVLGIEPNNVQVIILKGKILSESKRYGEAFSSYKKALEIEPRNEEARKLCFDEINKIMLIPIKNSNKYIGNIIIELRNSKGVLIGVTVSDALGYLPHEITDEYLDSIPINELVHMNDKTYEKREFQEVSTAAITTYVGRYLLSNDELGFDIFAFDVLPHAMIVEKGDRLVANWTILRQVN